MHFNPRSELCLQKQSQKINAPSSRLQHLCTFQPQIVQYIEILTVMQQIPQHEDRAPSLPAHCGPDIYFSILLELLLWRSSSLVEEMGYELVTFTSKDRHGQEIYHTNASWFDNVSFPGSDVSELNERYVTFIVQCSQDDELCLGLSLYQAFCLLCIKIDVHWVHYVVVADGEDEASKL